MFACVFMNKVETEFLGKEFLTPWVFGKNIFIYLFVWTHGEENLQNFLEHFNNFHSSLSLRISLH